MKLLTTKFSYSQKKRMICFQLSLLLKFFFDAYKISCKAKFSQIDKDEIFILKNKINFLGEVLKKCEFDKSRLEAMFPKKHIPKKQTHATHTLTHKSQHLHSHHAKHTTQTKHAHTPHTNHAFMYGKFMHALIVAERATWLNFVLIE